MPDRNASIDRGGGYWIRARELFSGATYTLAITLALIAMWAVEYFLLQLRSTGAWASMQSTVPIVLMMLLHQLPTVPLVIVMVNLAPRTGFARYAWLAVAATLAWAFCTALFIMYGVRVGLNLEYAAMVMLVVAASAYRSSARAATSAHLQQHLWRESLDAEIKHARLQLLRAQIEPHFLFNTLSTVRTLARIDRSAAVEMIDNLLRYLSEALPKLRRDESSLGEELQLIDAYLRIHQVRMGERLSYEFSVPQALQAERIPTMVLLTLVENSLKHGINPEVCGGSIRISAIRKPAALLLQVADSGGGMTVTEGTGTGLANIRRRLTALYGDSAGLSLAPAASQGMIATVAIPRAFAV